MAHFPTCSGYAAYSMYHTPQELLQWFIHCAEHGGAKMAALTAGSRRMHAAAGATAVISEAERHRGVPNCVRCTTNIAFMSVITALFGKA